MRVRALVLAGGAHETTAGNPHWPIDPSQVTNGAMVMHSSGVNAHPGALASAKRKFVVGASKAAIDILEILDPADESVVWAHRGHILLLQCFYSHYQNLFIRKDNKISYLHF